MWGILLTAVGIDGNNCMYPFAYAVVEKEKKSTWLWFLELLLADWEIPNDSGKWTIMSDRQKGLIDAVNILMPYADHRHCVLHLYNNFKKEHKGLALKLIMWKAAKATRVVDFEKVMEDLRKRDIEAFKWLAKKPSAQWTKAFMRQLPIIDMLETIRMTLMKRIYMKRDAMKKCKGVLCPNIEAIVEENKKNSMGLKPLWNGHEHFEVECGPDSKFTVQVGERTCSCRKWQLTGIPCHHAIACLYFIGYKPEDFVDDCYKKSTFMATYSHLMYPLHGPEEWPKSTLRPLQPPIKEIQPGRPKQQNRMKPPEEILEEKNKKEKLNVKNVGEISEKLGKQGLILKCSICRVVGHNMRTCPQNPKNKDKDENIEVPPPNPDKVPKRERQNKQVASSNVASNADNFVGDNLVDGNEPMPNTQVSITGPTVKKRKLTPRRKGQLEEP